MIVVTAGHVDHGKTTLIKALTGQDTTHLPEERKRGMTIDLGFAGLALANGNYIGFIDVPGHERFMRNMLAGISGVDLALLIVAADDGIKPQTLEHVEVLDLLDVREMVVALTKIDRVDAGRCVEVTKSILALLASTALAQAPVFPVAAPNQVGVKSLREYLLSRVGRTSTEHHGGQFRMPIDRAFVAEGAGLILTGTIHSGKVRVGDQLQLLPHGVTLRVRGLHTHHHITESLTAGERCAVNVVAGDLDRSQVSRGDWIAASGVAVLTQHLDVRVRLASGMELRDAARILFCHGAASTAGRVLMLSSGADRTYVQIVLDQPIHALAKDRFIVRSADGRQTLAGGSVVDPWPPTRGRRRPERLLSLMALDQTDIATVLQNALACAPNGIDLDRLLQAWNIEPDAAHSLWARIKVIRYRSRGYDPTAWQHDRTAILDEVARFHAMHPDSFGPSAAQMLRSLSFEGRRDYWDAILASLIEDRQLLREGTQIRTPLHTVELSIAERALWRRIAPLLGPARRPMTIHDIAKTEKLEYKVVSRVLQRLARMGAVVRVLEGRYFHQSALQELALKAEALGSVSCEHLFGAAAFRDCSALGRGISIEVLEYFDRIGFTQRIGDQRRVIKRSAEIFGSEHFVTPGEAR